MLHNWKIKVRQIKAISISWLFDQTANFFFGHLKRRHSHSYTSRFVRIEAFTKIFKPVYYVIQTGSKWIWCLIL